MRTLAFILLTLVAVTLQARADDSFRDGEKAFLKARELLQKGYVDDKLSDDKMWRAATDGLLHGVGNGKWDELLSPSKLAAMKADLVGEVVGLGVQIEVDSDAGIVDVRGVVPNSGAERAGLMVGDKILRLDGKTFKGMSKDEVARTMRGKAGTSATLTILRDAEMVTKTIKRSAFVVDPVVTAMLPGGVGLVQIKMITSKTPALVSAALDKLRGMKGLVVDLRDNQGGRYDTMFDVAGLMLPKGALVVSEIRRGGAVVEKHTSAEPRVTVPIVVLVDNMTASGAEVLAGALKQAGAKVVGKRTMGKWNAQELYELGNGWGIKYTIMVFRAASGAMLDGKGLEPDVEVEADPAMVAQANVMKDGEKRLAADAQLRVATTILKLKLGR
ncbi:MAG TPA: S41 family peptidase [Polyangia bacterium]|nr:S41 family peptidase [Polyangia bacterium]